MTSSVVFSFQLESSSLDTSLEDWSIHENGNRFVAVLIYLPHLDHGKAKAFVKGGLGVRPEKGSALFGTIWITAGKLMSTPYRELVPCLLVANGWITSLWVDSTKWINYIPLIPALIVETLNVKLTSETNK